MASSGLFKKSKYINPAYRPCSAVFVGRRLKLSLASVIYTKEVAKAGCMVHVLVCGVRYAVRGVWLALCQPKLTEWMRSHFPTNSPFEEPALSETKGGQGDVNFHSVKFFLMQGARSGSPIIIDLNSEP